jgi:hypothetical protein
VPGKAATRALDDESNGIAFDFYLAEKLGLMVCEMRDRMPEAEYVLWTRYYALKAQQAELANKVAAR